MEKKAFLDRLSDEERAALRDMMVVREHKDDSMIISHEDDARDVYFVLNGLARVVIDSEDGKPVAFRDVPAGEIFGELAAIDNLPRSASIVAVGQMTTGSLSSGQFKALVERNPSFTWALLSHLAQQSRSMTERIFEFSTMLVKTRVIRELLRNSSSMPNSNQRLVSPDPNRSELAARISTHREAVSRVMGRLQKDGLTETRDNNLILLDPKAMRAECQMTD